MVFMSSMLVVWKLGPLSLYTVISRTVSLLVMSFMSKFDCRVYLSALVILSPGCSRLSMLYVMSSSSLSRNSLTVLLVGFRLV